jgi:hypothetical protein
MPPTFLSRPFIRPNCLLNSTKPSKSSRHLQQRRHESSYRRHVQRLSLPPAPTFTPGATIQSSSHIIFNPPASSPNVYHTPLKFLPASDKRRQLYASAAPSLYNVATSSKKAPLASPVAKPGTALHETYSSLPASLRPQIPNATRLPTPLKAPYEKKYHLTEADISEIKRLRAEDPRTWTREALAEKFNCSQFFISIAAKNESAGLEHERRMDEVKKRWGPGRSLARHERGRRKQLWGRDA